MHSVKEYRVSGYLKSEKKLKNPMSSSGRLCWLLEAHLMALLSSCSGGNIFQLSNISYSTA